MVIRALRYLFFDKFIDIFLYMKIWKIMKYLQEAFFLGCTEIRLKMCNISSITSANLTPEKKKRKNCTPEEKKKFYEFWQKQLIVQIRAWESMQAKENDVLTQVQELFCLREQLVTSSNPRSDPETAKGHFSRRVTSSWKGDFCHFKESANLILVDIKLILVDSGWHWHWVDTAQAPSRWPRVGHGGSIGTDTLSKIVKIANGNLQLFWKSALLVQCIKQDSEKV